MSRGVNGPVTKGNFALLHPIEPSFNKVFAKNVVFPEYLIVRDRIYDRSLTAIRAQTPAPARWVQYSQHLKHTRATLMQSARSSSQAEDGMG